MSKCHDCAVHALHLHTISLTIAASQGRIDECRRLGHVPYKRLQGKHDVCVNCLRHGWATMVVLDEVVSKPQDLAGRPLRGAGDDPMEDGGVWAAMPRESIWKRVGLVLLLLASAAAFFGVLVWWVQ